jgi:hypothetical protein
MRTPRLTYVLLALLLLTHVDDTWTLPVTLSAPVLDVQDDEYLPAERLHQCTRAPSRQKPALIALKSRTSGFCLLQRGERKSGLAGPFAPPSLHVFMSMQC